MVKNVAGNQIKWVACGTIVWVLTCLAATVAQASLITFSGGSGAFTTPYTENGFTITPLTSVNAGPWEFTEGLYTTGGYIPSWAGGQSPFAGIEVQRATSGQFTFNSVFLSTSPAEWTDYSVSGYSGGSQVANVSGVYYPGGYSSTVAFASPNPDLDALFITFQEGQPYYVNFEIDDVNVSTVPDQASTFGLLALALVPLIALGVRQRRLAAAR